MSKTIIRLFVFLALTAGASFAQTTPDAPFKVKKTGSLTTAANAAVKSSPAYAEILLRRAENAAELESLLLDYTEDYPKVKAARYEFDLLQKAADKIAATGAGEAGKLTVALGKLIVRKIALEVDLLTLKTQLSEEHADVRRATRKIEVFDRAIKEILP